MTIQLTDAFVTLATVNLEKITDFYRQLLGEKPRNYIPNVYAEFQLPEVKLGIFQPTQTHKAEFANSAQSTMSLCLEVTDLEGAIAHLTTMGYPPPEEISTASHGREIYAYDPDGNRIILHQSV
ncbi:MAG: VOC family protein [Nostocaceae cyanobacterium]|nr:VOC family protein [Nostocaceae cyanobacterium]